MNEQFGGSDASGIIKLEKGKVYGKEYEFGSSPRQISTLIESAASNTTRKIHFNDQAMRSYDWTSYMREIFIELKEIEEFRFSAMFHWVVDTPVAAAQDHNWMDDVTVYFTLYTSSRAIITTFSHYFRRGCGHYLYEVPDIIYTSQVAHPITNLGSQLDAVTIGGSFRLRVTAC